MLRLAADENFNNDVVRGVRRREPAVDILRIQDAGLLGAADPAILEWAAQAGRVLLTHDVATLTRYAYDRVRDGKPMPGVDVTCAPSTTTLTSLGVSIRRKQGTGREAHDY